MWYAYLRWYVEGGESVRPDQTVSPPHLYPGVSTLSDYQPLTAHYPHYQGHTEA